MQTTQIISPQSGAAGQLPLSLPRAEQSLSVIKEGGDGFLAMLSEHEGAGANPVPDAITLEAAEVGALSPAVFGAACPWLLPVVAATEAPVSGTEGSGVVTATSGQGDLPRPDGSQGGSPLSALSGPGAPDLVAQSDGLGGGTMTGGAQSAPPALINPVVASLQEGALVALSQDFARPRAGTDGPRSEVRQDPGGIDQPSDKAASPSSGMDTFLKVPQPDLNVASAGTTRSATGNANLNLLQMGDVVPVAIAATLSVGDRAAVTISSSSGSFGAVVSGVAQGLQLDSKGSMPDVLPLMIRASQDGPLSEGTEAPMGPEASKTRPDVADEIPGQEDPPPPSEHARVEQTVRVPFPTTAAESLWRGAALVRLEGSGAVSNNPAELVSGGASLVMTAEAIKPVVMPGADRTVLQAATSAPSAQLSPQGSGLAWAPGEKIEPAPFSPGHPKSRSGGSSGGPTMQLTQAAASGVQTVPVPDPTPHVEGEILLEPDLAWPVGFAAGSASAVPLFASASPAMPNLPPTVAYLFSQIATAVAQNPDGVTEIALSPEELGRVQITLQADARQSDRMVIFLSFDRPETLELFRRHSDQLAEAMRMAGYSGADINFGQHGTGAGGNSGTGTNQAESGHDNGSYQGLVQSASRASDTVIGPGDLNAPKHGAASALDLRL